MKKFLEEFKNFIARGNVMDMAVGVIIGGAFTAIVTSLNKDIITPILAIFGGVDFSKSFRKKVGRFLNLQIEQEWRLKCIAIYYLI